MKYLVALLSLFIYACTENSVQTVIPPVVKRNISIDSCDKLEIVFYRSDTFSFTSTAPKLISNFKELINKTQDPIPVPGKKPANKIIYWSKIDTIITATVFWGEDKSGTSMPYIHYILGETLYEHKITYRTGMGMDQIYWHWRSPESNPWTDFDSSIHQYRQIH